MIGQLLERFYFHRFPFPALFSPTTLFTYVHVDDVAEGFILAAEKGRVGESYIITGPAASIGEMVDFWARLTGKRPPTFHVPAGFVRPLIPIVKSIGEWIDLPLLVKPETLALMGRSYLAQSTKAEEELGWRSRPVQVGFLETFAALASEAADHPRPITREREVATIALGAALVLLLGWLLHRWRKNNH